LQLVRWFLACLSAALLLGGGSAGAAAETEDVIVLGAAVSLTGKYAQNGANTKNGYDLAVAEINEKGGIDIAGKN
jgi:branched-chain amino acid transport system substrate-binding protein